MTYTPDYTIQLPGDVKIHLLFNTWAIKHFCLAHHLEIEEMYGKFKAKELDSLMLIAHESYCKYTDTPFKATELDSCEWADALGGYNGKGMFEMLEVFLAKSMGLSLDEYRKRVELSRIEPKKVEAESPNA